MQIDSGSENRGRGGPIFLHISMVCKCSVGFRAMAGSNSIDLQEGESSVGRIPTSDDVSRRF